MSLLLPERLGRGVQIAGTGAHLPPRIVTNADLVAMGAPLTDDEIVRLSGIHARRWVGPDESTSDLAAEAGRHALSAAGIPAPDRLILATNSPDHLVPSTACRVHAALQLGHAPAVDVNAACAGFLYGLDLGARAILTGDAAALVVAAEVRSRFLDPSDRSTVALFGDGAGACVLTPCEPGRGLVAVLTGADGRGAAAVTVPAGGAREPASHATVENRRHTIHMHDGPQVYLSAVEGMVQTATALLDAVGLGVDDIDLLVPHQANRRLIDRIARFTGVQSDRVFRNVDRYGNMSSASVPVALHEALQTRGLAPGSRVLLLAAGAGYTAGAALYVV